MNITILLGIVIGFGMTLFGITQNGEINNFVEVASLAIVLGGTIGAVVASYPMEDLKKLPTLIKLALKKSDNNYMEQVNEIVEMANVARKNGILALEDRLEDIKDPFVKNGVMLIMDGTDPELVKSMLETQSYFTDERHAKLISMFETASSCAPAFGMIGTLIGLINMLKNLTDNMDTIGPAMSTALITTFYGVIFANLIFSPIARQLAAKNAEEMLCKDIIIEGILSIQDGENPRVIEDKLKAFVAASDLEGGKKKAGRPAEEAPEPEGEVQNG